MPFFTTSSSVLRMRASAASLDSLVQPSSPAIRLISLLESSSPHIGDGELPRSLVSRALSKGLALLSRSTLDTSSALKSSPRSVLRPSSQASTT